MDVSLSSLDPSEALDASNVDSELGLGSSSKHRIGTGSTRRNTATGLLLGDPSSEESDSDDDDDLLLDIADLNASGRE